MLSTYIGGHEIVDEVFCRGQFEREVLFLCAGETTCHLMSRLSERCRTSHIGHGEICGGDVGGISQPMSFVPSCGGGDIARIWTTDGGWPAMEG